MTELHVQRRHKTRTESPYLRNRIKPLVITLCLPFSSLRLPTHGCNFSRQSFNGNLRKVPCSDILRPLVQDVFVASLKTRIYLHIIPIAKNFTGGPIVMGTGLLNLKDILFLFDTTHPDTHVNIKQVIILKLRKK